ncbi:hypothetical protein [Streptomyces sp. NEAU-W12]|nr:hypothetical protein [Streptomyces sp. NEAU-W12]MCX2927137.1 hypothetical protein [Streptomyces sp. NEAU-W12]
MVKADKPARAFCDRMGFHEIEARVDDSVTCPGRSTRDLGRL